MGWLSNNLGIKAFSLEDPAQPLLPMSALFESLGIGRSDAGMMVNEKQALRLTTAYGCIKIISEDLSHISLDIFQQMPDDSMRLATTHREPGLARGHARIGLLLRKWLFVDQA